MLKKPTIILLITFLFSTHFVFSQNMKFGKVSKEELQEKMYPLDSSANAAILYKKRRTYYDYDSKIGWTLVTKIHERIKIYNKDGNKWATKKISLYNGKEDERVSIRAYTFNLVNDKIEKTKLGSNEIFAEKVNKYWERKKFTMPNLTKGSVIEWEYTIKSPYFSNINDMVFEYEIPVKFIDSEVKIPEYFVFKNQMQGFLPINLTTKSVSSALTINSKNRTGDVGFGRPQTTFSQSKINFSSKVSSCIQENIPSIKKEPYVNNIDNYKTLLKFEISATKYPNSIPKFYNTTWEDVTKTIYQNTNFGEQLKKASHFKDDIANIVSNASSSDEKILAIYNFVKSKIKWDNYRSKYTVQGVKKAYKEGTGNVAEINLTLVAMLRAAGLKANPILVSTRDNGVPLFPTSQGFNYVIAGVELANSTVLLDATEIYAPSNTLPLRALNWQGRMVRKDGSSDEINLSPKKYSAKKVYANVKLNEDALVSGYCRTMYYNLKALNYRNDYNKVNNQDLIGKLEKENQDIEISELKVSNENDIGKPLGYTFAFETDNQVEVIGDKMYFAPLLFLTEKENPFKLENRTYPVDFGARFENKYTVSIHLPEGYKIESKPENIGYTLPDGIGSFRYATILKGNKLQVLSNTKINMGIIGPNYYEALKEFYKKVIEKQVEKIVLSKI